MKVLKLYLTLFKASRLDSKALIMSADIVLQWCIFPNKYSIKIFQNSYKVRQDAEAVACFVWVVIPPCSAPNYILILHLSQPNYTFNSNPDLLAESPFPQYRSKPTLTFSVLSVEAYVGLPL